MRKLTKKCDERKTDFSFGLGDHSQRVGDERDLSYDVSFFHPIHLTLPNKVHGMENTITSSLLTHKFLTHGRFGYWW